MNKTTTYRVKYNWKMEKKEEKKRRISSDKNLFSSATHSTVISSKE